MVLTSVSDFISAIEQDEVVLRERWLKLYYAVREIGERRLLTRSLNWQRFLYVRDNTADESTEAAESAMAAHGREANRKRWARQKALRSGVAGLKRAIG